MRLHGHPTLGVFALSRDMLSKLTTPLRTPLAAHGPTLGTAQLDTWRLRLLKVAALVVPSTRRLLVRLPHAFPLAARFRPLAATVTIPHLSTA